jgi:uncharacterized delta-60 repeat protein
MMRSRMVALAMAFGAVLALTGPAEAAAPGALVTSFGTSGAVTVPPVTKVTPSIAGNGSAVRAPSGRIYVATKRERRQSASVDGIWIEVVALTSAGRPDASFHGGKPLVLGPAAGFDGRDGLFLEGPWVTPSGGVAVAARDFGGAVIYRLSPTGRLDTTFSGDGKLRLAGSPFGIIDVTMLSTGAFRAIEVETDAGIGPATLVGLTPAGAADTAVGPSGRRDLGISWSSSLRSDASDRLYLLAYQSASLQALTVYRFTSSGELDTAWGSAAGHSDLALPSAPPTSVPSIRMAAGPDGSLFVAVSKVHDPVSGFWRPVIVKLGPTGTADGAFGTAGVQMIPSATGSGAIDAFAVDPTGRLLVSLHEMPGVKKFLERRSGTTGAIDAGFGTAGKVALAGTVTGITPVTTSILTVSSVLSGGVNRVVLARRWN